MLKVAPVKFEQKFVTVRDFSYFDEESFFNDLESAQLNRIFYLTGIDEKVEMFSNTILSVFDKKKNDEEETR